jgi:hypothetical protein
MQAVSPGATTCFNNSWTLHTNAGSSDSTRLCASHDQARTLAFEALIDRMAAPNDELHSATWAAYP